MTTKDRVLQLVSEMPDECTLDDIGYRLYVLQSVQTGLDQLDRGDSLSHEEAGEELRPWLTT